MSQMLLKWRASMGCCLPSRAPRGRLLLLAASRLSWWMHIAPTWWSSWLITSPVATVSSVKGQVLQMFKFLTWPHAKKHLAVSLQFLSTFGFFDDMADAEPMAHMMKGLVPRIAPLIYVITGAGPDQVVQCIITCSCKAKDYRNKCHLNWQYIVWLSSVSSRQTWQKLSSPSPATWAPLPRELPGASMRSARLLNWPSARLNTRLEAKTNKKTKS